MLATPSESVLAVLAEGTVPGLICMLRCADYNNYSRCVSRARWFKAGYAGTQQQLHPAVGTIKTDDRVQSRVRAGPHPAAIRRLGLTRASVHRCRAARARAWARHD